MGFFEAKKRLVIRQVPEWMGGVRLTGQPDGTLIAEEALDFLFDEFQPLRQARTCVARWDIVHCLIIVQMSLRRKPKEKLGGKDR